MKIQKFLLFLLLSLLILPCFAVDKYSKEYLTTHKHFSIMNPMAEKIAENVIQKSLKKETKGEYKVQFDGYTLSSMKKGIFKKLIIQGKNLEVEGITIPQVNLKTDTDYNYIEYDKNPVVFKSDMIFSYELFLSAESLNQALANKNYKAVIENLNSLAYPMFQAHNVSSKIVNNKLYILLEYNFPIAPTPKNRVFVASSDFMVKNGKIKAVNVKLDSAYGKISLNKVANLLNLLNPLEFTVELLDSKKCDANIENVNIVDNKVKIDGKIFVKGE